MTLTRANSVGLGLASLLAMASLAWARTAPGLEAGGSGWCGLAAYRNPTFNGDGPIVAATTTPVSGGLRFEGRCGIFDFFTFGPDGGQAFAGGSSAVTVGEARFGVLRSYAAVSVVVGPTQYGPPFVIGTNPYHVRAYMQSGPLFADVFVPPATASAPNVGDPTKIKATVHLDCVETAETGTIGVDTAIRVNIYTPEAYAADTSPYDGVFYHTDVVPGVLRAYCPIDQSTQFDVTVGTPVVIELGIVTKVDSSAFFAPSFIDAYTLYSNALNTGTVTLTTEDDVPLVGQSGTSYGPTGPLPTVTTTSTSSSTSTLFATTTTLPGCAGTCGDGVVDAACGEACDCAPTDDPVQAAYGCDGSAVIPPQEECVTCRGCRLLPVRCQVAGATTTTSLPPGGSSTTTSLPPGGSTTTTVPGAVCAGRTGVAGVRCVIDAARNGPACEEDAFPKAVTKRLDRGVAVAEKAAMGSSRKATKLFMRARALLVRAGKAAKNAATGRRPTLSAACATDIERATQAASALLSSVAARP